NRKATRRGTVWTNSHGNLPIGIRPCRSAGKTARPLCDVRSQRGRFLLLWFAAGGGVRDLRADSVCLSLPLEFYTGGKPGGKIRDLDALLIHRIAITDRYTAILAAVKVVGDAEGSADLILTAVTLTDRTGVVK